LKRAVYDICIRFGQNQSPRLSVGFAYIAVNAHGSTLAGCHRYV